MRVGEYKKEVEEKPKCDMGDENDRPDLLFHIPLQNGGVLKVCEGHYYQYYKENPVK